MQGYWDITCHIIFEVKLDFTLKAIFVANGSKSEAPGALTYSRVVSRDSVRLAFLTAALNDLYMIACDIGNTNINIPCKYKICFKASAECGEHR